MVSHNFAFPRALRSGAALALSALLSLCAGNAHAQNATNAVAVPNAEAASSGEAKTTDDRKENEPARLQLLSRGMESFYTWLEGAGVFVDNRKVFGMEDGVLRISGERVGYLATRGEYSDFRLVVEYKWGEAKFGDRSTKPRNSGLLIHGVGEDKEWMRGFECQIAEGRTGNVVIHGGARMTVGTNDHAKAWTEIGKTDRDVEVKHGEWNTMEVLSVGPKLRVLINGQQTIEAANLLPNRGKILLQSNGAEIFFRRLDIYPLTEMPPAPEQTEAAPEKRRAAQ